MIEWLDTNRNNYFNVERTYVTLYFSGVNIMLLTKEQILQARSRRSVEVIEVPFWGGEIIIIGLSGKERDAFEADMVSLGTNGRQQMNLRNVRAKLVGRSIVDPKDYDLVIDESGKIVEAKLKDGHVPQRLFNDIEINDLGDVDAASLQLIFERAQRLSGITKADVDELVGELKNDRSGASGLN